MIVENSLLEFQTFSWMFYDGNDTVYADINRSMSTYNGVIRCGLHYRRYSGGELISDREVQIDIGNYDVIRILVIGRSPEFLSKFKEIVNEPA